MSHTNELLKLYNEIEGPLNEALSHSERPISCKEGCNHCCYMMTMCGVTEGRLMAEKVLSLHAWKYYVKKMRQGAKEMDHCNQSDYFQKRIPCVFLNKKGLCDVYDVRPAACRYYFVVSPPEDCSPTKVGQQVLAVNTSEPETAIWAFEAKHSRTGYWIFAPLPMMVLHMCFAVAMENGQVDKAKFIKQQLKGITDPITWMESVDIEEMGRNTPDTMEAYSKAAEKFGLRPQTGGDENGLVDVQERLRQAALRGSFGPRQGTPRARQDAVVLYDHTGKPFPQSEREGGAGEGLRAPEPVLGDHQGER